jgi:acyl dehydratase
MTGLEAVEVGFTLPPLTLPPISRATLALYAGGSGDHVPLHIDSDFARTAGYPDVFAHGMLGMAYLGRLVTGWAPVDRVRELSTRFKAIVQVGDVLTCTGTVVEIRAASGERLARIEIGAVNQHGTAVLTGEALVSLEPKRP